MLRKDREITDFDEIIGIINACKVCRLALHNKDYPYILPLNFGMIIKEDHTIVLYFHGADKGKKYELIKENNRVAFEMDYHLDYVSGSLTTHYASVIGTGIITFIEKFDQKRDALNILTKHYETNDFEITDKMISGTTVFKLTVHSLTAKKNIK
ncbi:hypothetical protein SDC9_151020 [bioreactor metagenome]|uniref:Pyridoxamine 5'-phosphate oxidase putative domain-containing protein n=1 Tax=bioreactor metagenome TaxID=1076179 RepID=A0A645EQR7_9ZZZZ